MSYHSSIEHDRAFKCIFVFELRRVANLMIDHCLLSLLFNPWVMTTQICPTVLREASSYNRQLKSNFTLRTSHRGWMR
jgi:hypothetical protein